MIGRKTRRKKTNKKAPVKRKPRPKPVAKKSLEPKETPEKVNVVIKEPPEKKEAAQKMEKPAVSAKTIKPEKKPVMPAVKKITERIKDPDTRHKMVNKSDKNNDEGTPST
ncbi:MAG: hypothetical protein KAG06_01590, partial [Methylococcales bacterium]|nr:hypothetical protein [Methylococcales bacterium]